MMKKGVLILGILMTLFSCSEYQKALKSEDTATKYSMAEKIYNEAKEEDSDRKYRKAVRLLDQIVPEFRGKPQGQKLVYLYADSYFQVGDYYLSSFQFERFLQSYPKSDRAEEALYKMAKSYYYLSPRYYVDQTDTDKAITQLQNYLNTYPDGEYADEVNTMATELRVKLEKKAYEIAKQYNLTGNYRSGNYTAAITSFNNFLSNYPGSPFREKAYFYKLDSAYKLAINSYRSLMEERLKTAQDFAQDYKKYYPNGEFQDEVAAYTEDINSRLQNL